MNSAPLVHEVIEFLGVVRYVLLWSTCSIGLSAVVVALWVNGSMRARIAEACRSSSAAPRRRCLTGLATVIPLVIVSIVLIHTKVLAILGIALLIAILVVLVLPGVAVASLRLGAGLSRELGRPGGDLTCLVVGLCLLQGCGFLLYVGLIPWLYFVGSGIGGVISALLGRVGAPPAKVDGVTATPPKSPVESPSDDLASKETIAVAEAPPPPAA